MSSNKLEIIKNKNMKQKTFLIPTKWCIKGDGTTNSKIVAEYLNKNTTNYFVGNSRGYYYCNLDNKISSCNLNKLPGYTLITFKQFKEHILKQKPMIKVTKLNVQPKVQKPMTHLPKSMRSFRINRTPTQLSFGCGEVKVNKVDLAAIIAAIPALRKLEVKRKRGEKYRNNNQRIPTADQFMKMNLNTLKRILG